MTTPSNKELADQPTVRAFVKSAEAYCHLIENHQALSRDQFVTRLALLLPPLYSNCSGMPDIQTDHESEKLDISDHSRDFQKSMASLLGEFNFYRDAFDPYDKEERELMTHELGYDLADIYKEVKEGLLRFQRGGPFDILEATWHWKFGMISHWGWHLTPALHAIHFILRRL